MEWIKCSDRLPEMNQYVHVYDGYRITQCCRYELSKTAGVNRDKTLKFRKNGVIVKWRVTHWMPIETPKPPQSSSTFMGFNDDRY